MNIFKSPNPLRVLCKNICHLMILFSLLDNFGSADTVISSSSSTQLVDTNGKVQRTSVITTKETNNTHTNKVQLISSSKGIADPDDISEVSDSNVNTREKRQASSAAAAAAASAGGGRGGGSSAAAAAAAASSSGGRGLGSSSAAASAAAASSSGANRGPGRYGGGGGGRYGGGGGFYQRPYFK